MPASASPVEETTLPASSDAPSAASVALGDAKAQTVARTAALNAVSTRRLDFIAVTFLGMCAGTGRLGDDLLQRTMIRLQMRGFNRPQLTLPGALSIPPVAVDHVLERDAELDPVDLPQHVDHDRLRHRLRGVVRRDRH